MKKAFLIDGNSFCYRAFYAIRNLSNSKGQPTNAVYGFITMLNKIKKEQQPDYIAVSFDLKEPTFRHKKFKEYKIHRKPMPDELISQMPIIKKVVRAFNIPIFEIPGYEADDILATLAKKLEKQGMEVFIATGDKDAMQLVGPHIKLYSPYNKEAVVYDRQAVVEKFGVEPESMTELMALMGDSSDNIPGIPGIGPKTASELVREFSTLEEIVKNVDSIKRDSVKELIGKHIKQARMSRELAILDCSAPVKIGPEDIKSKEPDSEKLYDLFKELEFKSFLKEFAAASGHSCRNILADKEAKINELIRGLSASQEFAFDFETTNSDPMLAEPVCISFCWKADEAWFLPLAESADNRVQRTDLLKRLKPIFENDKIGKIGQNIKYEVIVLKRNGIDLSGVAFDTMVASYLLNPSKANHNLDDIALEYLDYKTTPIEDLIGKGKKQLSMLDVPFEKLFAYSCQDSNVTFRLKDVLLRRLTEKGLSELFWNVELPLISVLADVEQAGVSIDTDFLGEMSKEFDAKLSKLTSRIYEMAQEEFNINSPKQLKAILFEKKKLPVIKRTKTGPSTDEEVLRRLALKDALPAAILDYRQLFKLKSTYIDALPELINKNTGRIHTSFNQTVTQTGRLSSSRPNLQNIPIKTEAGRSIRRAFIARGEKNRLLSADYSQIELRILAHMSADKELARAFKDGADIHSYTASLVNDVPQEEVTKEMRSSAKTVNFGIVYGMGPYGLSKDLGVSIGQAKDFIEAYFARYPEVKKFMTDTIEQARQDGFVMTLMNRRRYLPQINSQNMNLRSFAERTAINTPIQGSAADLIKAAMIKIHERLKRESPGSKMILQVHDELVFEVADKELKKVSKIVKDIMETTVELRVPIVASLKTGNNWLDMKAISY